MIINFEMYKFWKTYKKQSEAISYGSFMKYLSTDAPYATQVYQFICNTRSQHVKERVCLRQQ